MLIVLKYFRRKFRVIIFQKCIGIKQLDKVYGTQNLEKGIKKKIKDLYVLLMLFKIKGTRSL